MASVVGRGTIVAPRLTGTDRLECHGAKRRRRPRRGGAAICSAVARLGSHNREGLARRPRFRRRPTLLGVPHLFVIPTALCAVPLLTFLGIERASRQRVEQDIGLSRSSGAG